MKLLFKSLLVLFTAIIFYHSKLASKLTAISPLLRLNNLTARPTKFSTPLYNPSPSFASTSKNMTTPRKIQKSFLAVEQSEGAGARVRRSIGTPALRNFSPFLMLDHFTVHPGAGFPDHPHRGQETITYLLEGAVDHEDFAKNSGTIHAGDLQFMVCLTSCNENLA